MNDQLWCSNCERTHYRPTQTADPDSCNDCGTTLDERLPLRVRAKRCAGAGVGLVVLAVFVLGPPAVAIQQPPSEAALTLVLWALLLWMVWFLNGSGIVPRRWH